MVSPRKFERFEVKVDYKARVWLSVKVCFGHNNNFVLKWRSKNFVRCGDKMAHGINTNGGQVYVHIRCGSQSDKPLEKGHKGKLQGR